jgi:hypothetical protein
MNRWTTAPVFRTSQYGIRAFASLEHSRITQMSPGSALMVLMNEIQKTVVHEESKAKQRS